MNDTEKAKYGWYSAKMELLHGSTIYTHNGMQHIVTSVNRSPYHSDTEWNDAVYVGRVNEFAGHHISGSMRFIYPVHTPEHYTIGLHKHLVGYSKSQ
jgi:hypothetical protein